MAGSLNKVLLIGRLGADPEIKQIIKYYGWKFK